MEGGTVTLERFISEYSGRMKDGSGVGRVAGLGYVTDGFLLAFLPLADLDPPTAALFPERLGIPSLTSYATVDAASDSVARVGNASRLRRWCGEECWAITTPKRKERCPTCSGRGRHGCGCGHEHGCGACAGSGQVAAGGRRVEPDARPWLATSSPARVYDRALTGRLLDVLAPGDGAVTVGVARIHDADLLLVRTGDRFGYVAPMSTLSEREAARTPPAWRTKEPAK